MKAPGTPRTCDLQLLIVFTPLGVHFIVPLAVGIESSDLISAIRLLSIEHFGSLFVYSFSFYLFTSFNFGAAA